MGQLAKNDRLDARMLAVMAESIAPQAVAPCSRLLEALQELMRARQAAADEATALSNQLGQTKDAFLRRELGQRSRQVAAYIAKLEKEILKRLASDCVLARRYEIVLSIPGVGPIAAAWLVIGLSELEF
jgi:transposase